MMWIISTLKDNEICVLSCEGGYCLLTDYNYCFNNQEIINTNNIVSIKDEAEAKLQFVERKT